jgi:hypothetical protein
MLNYICFGSLPGRGGYQNRYNLTYTISVTTSLA